MRASYTFFLLALTGFSLSALAVTEAQWDAIRNLGRLNGIALHCEYLGETRRMKQALVEALPKRRELGLAFDEVTNDSFVRFIDEGFGCPPSADFSNRVDIAIEALKAAF